MINLRRINIENLLIITYQMKITKYKEATNSLYEQELYHKRESLQDLPLELLAKTFSYLSMHQVLEVLPRVCTKI